MIFIPKCDIEMMAQVSAELFRNKCQIKVTLECNTHFRIEILSVDE
jgi:hypothetical protein